MQIETETFRATKPYDVLIAAPLIVFYGFSIAGLLPQIAAELRILPSPAAWLELAALASAMIYFALIIGLIFVRRMPVAKSQGLWPRALALVSGNMAVALLALPRVKMSVGLAATSTALAGGGTLAEILILLWLGRAFSILPEARRLVTGGPYRHIRHPLYLAGLFASVGAMLQFVEPWALLIVLVNFGLQLWRMQYEERVLTQAFPEYAGYAARSWRLVPGLY